MERSTKGPSGATLASKVGTLMDIFSLRHRRMRLALACFLLVPGAAAVATVGATADGGAIRVDRQAYNWDESPSPDPYPTAGDDELHVAAANGSTAAHALIHVDFASQKRTVKASGRLYSKIVASNGRALSDT